jgi:transcriptional regulator with XRE-family HTH domain
MISNLQIRAARALLGWSQQRLAEAAGVSAITVKRLEGSNETFQARFETVMKVKSAVEGAGVVFGGEGGYAHAVSLRQAPRAENPP